MPVQLVSVPLYALRRYNIFSVCSKLVKFNTLNLKRAQSVDILKKCLLLLMLWLSCSNVVYFYLYVCILDVGRVIEVRN